MDEKTLAKQLSAGDTKALENMIDLYSGYVRTVALNFSGGSLNAEDLDDLTAEVFYKLWRCRKNLDAEIGLRAYLSAAVKNLIKDKFKRKRPRFIDISELEIDAKIDIEKTAEMNEIMRCICDCLNEFPDADRDIFMRYYFFGEQAKKIAETMKIPKNTVGTKLRRMRKRLKEYLSERGINYV